MSEKDGEDKTKPSERVKVVVRCRPFTSKETKAGNQSVVNVFGGRNAIQIINPKSNKDTDAKTFIFDAVYDGNCTQQEMYHESVEPFVESVMEGYNATVFAYGQTGAGKTYTMEGPEMDQQQKGLMPRAFQHIFDYIESHPEDMFVARCSYLQLYRDDVEDLLDDSGTKSCMIHVDLTGVYVRNLKLCECDTAEKMLRLMKTGNRKRKTGKTCMNESSSRSHAIFVINIHRTRTINGSSQTNIGKLNLVDLAGSERQSKSHSAGELMKEAVKVNLSLIVLGKVISALTSDKPSHIPYRESKLTKLLQDSLGGNSKTLMIANIGPASANYVESLSTLIYADRAKSIKNKPITNEMVRDADFRLEDMNTKRSDVDGNTSEFTGSQTLNPSYDSWLTPKNERQQALKTHFIKEYEEQIQKLQPLEQELQLWINAETETENWEKYENLIRVLSYEKDLHMGIMLMETLAHFLHEKFLTFDQNTLDTNKRFLTGIIKQYNKAVKARTPKHIQRKLLIHYNKKETTQMKLTQHKIDYQNSSKSEKSSQCAIPYEENLGKFNSTIDTQNTMEDTLSKEHPHFGTPLSMPLPYFYGRKVVFGKRDSKFRDDITYRYNACGIKQYYIGDKPVSDNHVAYLDVPNNCFNKPLFEYLGNDRFLWREQE